MTSVLQLTDLHLGAPDDDRVEHLERAVAAALRLPIAFDAVLLTGDVADDGRTYTPAVERLATFEAPVHVVPGNHDDRATLRAAFDVPGAEHEPVRWAVRCGGLRLVGLDTTIPGADDGELRPDDLDWLRGTLAEDASTPTLLALHHPPVPIGLPAFDRTHPDGTGLAEVLASAPQVRRITCGHDHTTVASTLAGTPVLIAPPVTRTLALLDPAAEDFAIVDGTPGFVVHRLLGDALVAHVIPVD